MKRLLLAALLLPSPALAQWPGKIYRITSRADSGAGTLRECAESTTQYRTCEFGTFGYFDIGKAINIRTPYLRVLGQTAPGPVVIRGATLIIAAPHVEVEHIAVRPGDAMGGSDPGSRDSAQISTYGITGVKLSDVHLRHVSLTHSIDEDLDFYGDITGDVSVEDTIIAEGLYNSIHPKAGGHGYGILANPRTKGIRLQRVLIASNYDRNGPRVQGGSQGQMINSYVYNWGGNGENCWNAGLNASSSATDEGPQWDLIGNVMVAGPDSPKITPPCSLAYNGPNIPKALQLYVYDNLTPTRTIGDSDDWLAVSLPKTNRSLKLPASLPNDIIPSFDVKERLRATVGPRPEARDPIDARIVRTSLDGTGRIVDCIGPTHPQNGEPCPRNIGGWPELKAGAPVPMPSPTLPPEPNVTPTAELPQPPPTDAPTASVTPLQTADSAVTPTLKPTATPKPTPKGKQTPTPTPAAPWKLEANTRRCMCTQNASCGSAYCEAVCFCEKS